MQKIFLIEDDDYLARVYARAFHFAGFETELAMDGEAALEALSKAEELPVAIIMDILLPKMNGYDLLLAVRKDPRYAAVPIIMLTNSFAENNSQKFLSAGADAYLIKIEHQTKDIVEMVQEVIKRGHTALAGV